MTSTPHASAEEDVPFAGEVAFVSANDDVALLGVSGSDEVYWYDLAFESATEEFLVLAEEGGEISVSAAREIVPTIEIYHSSRQLVADSVNRRS